jgi:uncharacterized membrane protein
MIRLYSTRRIVGFFSIDLAGTLALLFVVALLRHALTALPKSISALAASLEVTLGDAGTEFALGGFFPLAPGIFILVAITWPFFLAVFSVYAARRNETLGAELRSVCLSICVSTLTLAGALFFTYRETSRLTILILLVLDIALLVGARLLLVCYRRLQGTERHRGRKIVLAGRAGVVLPQRFAGWIRGHSGHKPGSARYSWCEKAF